VTAIREPARDRATDDVSPPWTMPVVGVIGGGIDRAGGLAPVPAAAPVAPGAPPPDPD
jgi:hypothetical protein